MIYDYLIVGHGLAGGILARTLRLQGHKVLVIDEPEENSASRIAAGLINPLAGKRFAKSWLAEKFIPFAAGFYKALEQEQNIAIFRERPIFKIFSSIEDQNTWMAKSADEALKPFIENALTTLPGRPGLEQPFGGILIKQGGYVLIRKMLDAMVATLAADNAIVYEKFDLNYLRVTEDLVTYKEKKARHLVFCEGYRAIQNPLFNWLPFSPNKGEIIDVAIQNLKTDCIYNKAVYVVPLGEELFKIGATYNWRTPDLERTAEARAELLERVKQITENTATVINQYAGIRPAVRDRKPLIGFHPKYKRISIFNGMGSKGVMMAPYLAQQFAGVLVGKDTLLPEVNILRFRSLYQDFDFQDDSSA